MNEWTLRDYIRVLFRQQSVIIMSCVVVSITAVIGLMIMTRQYEATVKMLVSSKKQVDSPYYKELLTGQSNDLSLTQIEIVTSNPVLEQAVNALHLDAKPYDYEAQFATPLKVSLIQFLHDKNQAQMQKFNPQEQKMFKYQQAVEDLRKSIKVEPIKDTDMFIIKVRDYDPIEAATLANAVSRSYVIFDLQQQLADLKLKYGPQHPLVQELQDNIQEMTANLSGSPLPTEDSIGPASVKIIEQATVPFKPTGFSKATILIIAFIMSIFLGIILAFIFEYLDQTIKSSREVEEVLQSPLLGRIPQIKRRVSMLVNGQKLPSRFTSSFNYLADQISLLMTNKEFKSLLITACDLHEGTTTTAANLAITIAEHGVKNVVLVDANFRVPAVHKIFKLEPEAGLADILNGSKNINNTLINVQKGLSILPAGSTHLNPITLLDSPQMKRIIEELKSRFDIVLIDCPQLNKYQDGIILSSIADKVLLIVSENSTRRQVAQKVLTSLKEHNLGILGTVLNSCTYPIPEYIYDRI